MTDMFQKSMLHQRMPRLIFCFCLLGIVIFTSVRSPAQCASDPSGTCGGHKHVVGGASPFSEDFGIANKVVNQGGCCSSYVTVVEGCPARGYVNITNTAASNLVMRGWVQIGSATAPAGSEFAVRFNIDGVIRGEYVRKLTGQYPQGEDFNAVYPNLPAGSHQVRMQVWLIDSPGTSLTVSQSFIEVQGVPATLPSGTTANGNTAVVDGTWRQITDILTFTNTTPVNLSHRDTYSSTLERRDSTFHSGSR